MVSDFLFTSLRIYPFFKWPSSSTLFRVDMLSFREILFSVKLVLLGYLEKAVRVTVYTKNNQADPKSCRSKKIVKIMLGTWIFEDLQLQRNFAACTPYIAHLAQQTVMLCGWCDLCLYTGIFQRTLYKQPNQPLMWAQWQLFVKFEYFLIHDVICVNSFNFSSVS